MLPSVEFIRETERAMVICNACRYCEGFCAVFPAMERRRTFSAHDLIYLANLCHDCRGCYYACQYAPPHEFDVNVPKILQELRVQTYTAFIWPRFMAGVFCRNGLTVSLITVFIMTIMVVMVTYQRASVVFSSHLGEDAFYRVIPHALISMPALLILLWSFGTILMGIVRFWQNTGGKLGKHIKLSIWMRAIAATLTLKHLKGAGHGCNYPDESFTPLRRWFHHLTFYGFMLCFAATACAALYENILHRVSPYPLLSLPVSLGTVGGIALLIGSGGLFLLKWRSDRAPANASLAGMDLVFSILLFMVSLTGLLLLALRETPAMGTVFCIHLGLVLSLFFMLPYSKFVHAVYRFSAIIQDTIEKSKDGLF